MALALLLAFSATAATPTITGSIVLTDQMWTCDSPVDLDLVQVTITAASPDRDAVHLRNGCTGRIGQLVVQEWLGDGVKVAEGAHDLNIQSGLVSCYDKAPDLHQDGIQVLGGSHILFSHVTVNCGRKSDTWVNSDLFINMAGSSTVPPSDVVCDRCSFGGWAAHTVDIQNSVRSGVSNSQLCSARYPKLTLAIGPGAVEPVNLNSRIVAGRSCSG